MELINNWISVTTDFFGQPISNISSWLSLAWHLLVGLVGQIINLLDKVNNEILISGSQILTLLVIPLTLIYIANSVTKKITKELNNRQQRFVEIEQNKQQQLVELEKNKQLANRRQTILRDYFQQMTVLLIDKELSTQDHEHPIARVSRALTLSAIAQLDSGCNAMLTRFLVEAELIQTKPSELDKNVPCLLKGADLEGANLVDTKLKDADLEGVCFKGANLKNTCLENANLFNANLINANLENANLSNVNMIAAELINANLVGANLSNANLSNANLIGANLSSADLSNTDLFGANLTRAKFEHTNLKNTLLGKNQGIDKKLKADLIKRGAIFGDSPAVNPSF